MPIEPYKTGAADKDIAIPTEMWIAVSGRLGDEKARKWFFTPNTLLGDWMPTQMIAAGRKKRLMKIINGMLEGSYP